MSIFFNPSITETAGNVTLEAMAAGLCCVAAGGLGTKCYVRDGETGLLSPPEAAAEDYAEKLLRLAGNAELRARMGAAGRARMGAAGRARMGAAGRARTLSEHRWPVILDELIAHYREAIRTFRNGGWNES